mmetsp:Transcript_78230/g.187576  ORF Transcript_78230/g.187576 Transcript_78230/m.187576 type:complete len:200 (-) Transcript_78230:157-756(-)
MTWQGEVAVLDLAEKIWHVLIIKGQRAAEQRVQHHPTGPNVHLRTHIGLASHHLGRRIVRRAAGGFQELPVTHCVGQAEVCDFHMQIRVQKEILWLEISVRNHALVAVLHTGKDLLKESSGFVLLELQLMDDVVKKLAPGHILHDHEDVARGVKQLVQADDMRMLQELQDLNLSPDLLMHVHVLHLSLVDDLDGYLLAG